MGGAGGVGMAGVACLGNDALGDGVGAGVGLFGDGDGGGDGDANGDDDGERVLATSSMDWGRSSRDLASMARINRDRLRGTLANGASGTSPCRWPIMIWNVLSPGDGGVPVTSSYRIAPRA